MFCNNQKTTLLLDMSPIFYSNLFSATNVIKKENHFNVSIIDGKYQLEEYKDVLIYKIFNEIAQQKNLFDCVDEVVLAFDNSKGSYWRKDVWEGYKAKRKKPREESEIQWDKAFEIFDEIKDILKNCSSFKCIDIERVEGDDVIFVLSNYLSTINENVIISSIDHDFIQCLEYPNVKFWRTQKSQGKEPIFYEATASELEDIIMAHVIQGDPGDGFGNIKAYSRFSEEFIEKYPKFKGKEYELYSKRWQIEQAFKKKYGDDAEAYNHPRYGYKMFLRSKKTVEELLNENPIYKLNYEMNRKLALPEMIDPKISKEIIDKFNEAPTDRNNECLTQFFMKHRLLELSGQLTLF